MLMLDLTGANLISYLIRIIRDVAEKNPRFKQSLGAVTFSSNTGVRWNDVQIIVRSVTTSGTRLSPDYYMCTQRGRAILCKVTDKEGQFVEWVREVDATRQTPLPGVYYINVDFFNDQTRELGLTCQQFKWVEGVVRDAVGSTVYFRKGIDINTLTMTDASTGLVIPLTGFNQSTGAFAYLLAPTQQLVCTYNNGLSSPPWSGIVSYNLGDVVTYQGAAFISISSNTNVLPTTTAMWTPYNVGNPLAGTNLQPLTDYWYERTQSTVVCQSTLGGQEILTVPTNLSVTFTDQDDYQLRSGIDFQYYDATHIQLAAWTPKGSTITANALVKLNPYTTAGTNPENILQFGLQPGEQLASGQVTVQTTSGDFPNIAVNADGTATLPQLLQPGEWARWAVRIETPQVKAKGLKWELNSLTIVDPNTITYAKPNKDGQLMPVETKWVQSADPTQLKDVVQTSAGKPLLTNGQQTYVLPGLHLAIGDQVIIGDQVAILVSPTLTETYEVFGSKENLNFTLEVKANDLATASELSEMLKQQLLIMRRENTEADGLTIFEATRDYQGQARDPSATAPSYIFTVNISASADWKVFVPLYTRLVNFEITTTEANPDFQGKLQMTNRMTAFGATQFITSY